MKHANRWVAALAEQHATTTIVGERDSENVRTIRVSYADLNLVAARDERILHRRVGGAARKVCDPNAASLSDHGFADCVSGAWKGARPQMALAVRRAREIAATGTSSIPLVAIAIAAR